MMKMQFKAAAGAAAMALALAGGNALADSGYGYQTNVTPGPGTPPTPSPAAEAQATVKINVTTPKLIVLRVGARNAQTTLDFLLTPTIASAPGASPLVGNDQLANWNGAAPTFSANTLGAVGAYLWHNNNGDASLSCAITTPFTALLASDVLVDSTGGALAHPGTDTSCGTGNAITGLTRNTVYTGAWKYSLSTGAAAGGAAAGVDSEVVTYTATTL